MLHLLALLVDLVQLHRVKAGVLVDLRLRSVVVAFQHATRRSQLLLVVVAAEHRVLVRAKLTLRRSHAEVTRAATAAVAASVAHPRLRKLERPRATNAWPLLRVDPPRVHRLEVFARGLRRHVARGVVCKDGLADAFGRAYARVCDDGEHAELTQRRRVNEATIAGLIKPDRRKGMLVRCQRRRLRGRSYAQALLEGGHVIGRNLAGVHNARRPRVELAKIPDCSHYAFSLQSQWPVSAASRALNAATSCGDITLGPTP